MRCIADGVVMSGRIAVVDFVCPTEETRKEFDADYTIWMDTIQTGRFDDTNAMFEPLTAFDYNYRVTEWTDDTQPILEDMIKKYMKLL